MQLKGLNAMFGKGYLEDVNIAFQIRNRGNLAVFQPMSVAFHYQNSTIKQNVSQFEKKIMHIARKTFQLKWSAEIKVWVVLYYYRCF